MICHYKIFWFVSSDLADFEAGKSQVTTIISASSSLDNICRMDPVWNSWL